ncbi:MAG: hypothetical protein V7636_1340 [Actinomycetota bacterium]
MLDGLRVLDLTDERGLLCGQLLADMGARVVHVEPPGGSPERPTLRWRAHTRNQESVVVDITSASGRTRLLELIASCDVVVESAAVGTMADLGVDFDTAVSVNPSLVYVSISPFGQTGPKRGFQATDLTVQASAGSMVMNGFADRPPIRTGGVSAWSHAGVAAAGAALVALRWRDRSGLPSHVDISAQEAATLTSGFTLLNTRLGRDPYRRATFDRRVQGIWECADGFVANTVAVVGSMQHFVVNQLRWMAAEGAGCDELADVVARGEFTPDRAAELRETIAAFLLTRTKRELMAGALEHDFLLAPVNTTLDVLHSDQLRERDIWWHDGAVTMPGPFARFSATPLALRRPPPAVDEHDEPVFPARTAMARPAEPAIAPLDDVNVLDLSWVMAGPWGTRMLADYGANVVKVESGRKLDLMRLLGPHYQEGAPPENSAGFASIAAGKRSLALDLTKPEAREIVLDLVDWADVVCEAFSGGTMDRWGLGYEALRARKPEVIMVSSCLYGQTGPLASVAGYGTQGVAASGLAHGTGWKDRQPIGPAGPFTDFIAPRFLFLAVLGAFAHRARTGEGQYVDLSQAESSLHMVTAAIAESSVHGTFPDREANDDSHMRPHGAYPCTGDDEWVAVAVRDDADWVALCTTIDRADLAELRLDDRRERCAEIDDALSAWTSERSSQECEALLQQHGVPAHHVVSSITALTDPQIEDRDMIVATSFGGIDPALVTSSGVRLSSAAPHVGPAPTIGSSTVEILRDDLGYDAARIAELLELGVVAAAT